MPFRASAYRLISWTKVKHLLAAVAFFSVGDVAHAGLEICNDTSVDHSVSVGFKGNVTWDSEGWWNIAAGTCATTLLGDLSHRFYYIRVETPGWVFSGDNILFCVDDKAFEIAGDKDCALRGYRQEGFAKVDTGDTGTHFSHALSVHVKPEVLSENVTAAEQLRSHAISAVFQGCQPASTGRPRFCSLVADGMKFYVYGDGRTPEALLDRLEQVNPGRRVAVQGLQVDLFFGAAELVLHSVDAEVRNRYDRILERMQGVWQSDFDENDSFVISGAERVNRYSGAETSVDYVAIQETCGDSTAEGPFMNAWNSARGTGFCYEIERVSDNTLVLVYLPSGERLTYHRNLTN